MLNEERIRTLQQQLALLKKGKADEPLAGEGLVRSALDLAVARWYKPKSWRAPDISPASYPTAMPPKAVVAQMAEAAYAPNAPQVILEWKLVYQTPTLKFYSHANQIIVAIRGTADRTDVYADLKVAMGNLAYSTRALADLHTLEQLRQLNPGKQFYGVGHSLGGALVDLFIAQGLLLAGVSYNPAVEKSQLSSRKNYRIYMANDPLYNVMGKYAKIGEVRQQGRVSSLDSVAATQAVKAHLMSNFQGGRCQPQI